MRELLTAGWILWLAACNDEVWDPVKGKVVGTTGWTQSSGPWITLAILVVFSAIHFPEFVASFASWVLLEILVVLTVGQWFFLS